MTRRWIAAVTAAALIGPLLGAAPAAKADFWSDLKEGLGIAVDETQKATEAVVEGAGDVVDETVEGVTEAYEETKEGLGEAAHDIQEDTGNLVEKVTK